MRYSVYAYLPQKAQRDNSVIAYVYYNSNGAELHIQFQCRHCRRNTADAFT